MKHDEGMEMLDSEDQEYEENEYEKAGLSIFLIDDKGTEAYEV